MTDVYECPVDGCEFTGVKDSVLGHYSGTLDSAHDGGYHKSMAMVEDAEPVGTVAEPETQVEAQSDSNQDTGHETQSVDTAETDTDTSQSDGGSSGGDNPLVGDVPPAASQSSTSECCEQPDRVECGGHEFELDDGSRIRADDGDEFCSACGAIVEPNGEVLR